MCTQWDSVQASIPVAPTTIVPSSADSKHKRAAKYADALGQHTLYSMTTLALGDDYSEPQATDAAYSTPCNEELAGGWSAATGAEEVAAARQGIREERMRPGGGDMVSGGGPAAGGAAQRRGPTVDGAARRGDPRWRCGGPAGRRMRSAAVAQKVL
uniref:Uncharacterized protein n=1 Tax=Leersia perrieri TaxID=77586 RepID=A0A0D9WQB3_9ORYZ